MKTANVTCSPTEPTPRLPKSCSAPFVSAGVGSSKPALPRDLPAANHIHSPPERLAEYRATALRFA